MDDFANILQRDYGLRPQGKSAPMSVRPAAPSPFSSSAPSSTPASIQRTSSAGKPKNGSNRNGKNATSILGDSLDEDFLFGSSNGINLTSSGRNTFGSAASDMPVMYDDVFGGPPKFATPSYPPMPSSATQQNSSSQSYDDIFRMPVKSSSSTSASSNNASTFPVFDAPLYDDDIFGGVPGIRSGSVVYDDVFSGGSTVGTSPSVLEDLLGVSESRDRSSGLQQPAFDSSIPSGGIGEFDELLPGFGGIEPAKPRPTGAGKFSQHNSSGLDKDSHGMSSSDPFDMLHVDDSFNVPQSAGQASAPPFPDSDSLKVPYQPSGSDRRRYSNSDYEENIDASGNSSPHVSTAQSPSRESRYPSKSKSSSNSAQSYASVLEENHAKRNQSSSDQAEEQTRSSSSPKPQYSESAEAPSFHSPIRRTRQVYDDFEEPVRIPKVVENRHADEFWISVEDVKLVTEPTAAPPPSRRPPLPGLKHGHTTRKAAGSKVESNSRHESPQSTKLSSSRGPSEHSNRPTFNNVGNMYDELEEFASGVSRARKDTKMDMSANTVQEDIKEGSAAVSASAMAMKEAMERARSKLRDREKEDKESGVRVEEAQEDLNEVKEDEEEKARELEEKERARERDEREREAKALREREEREKRRREREKEKEREREREREKDRIAVERATQEARERAERAAVERATAEARERAAAEARQRVAVERVTAEARERAAAEARAAVERATAEARERAAAEARERAAAEARERAAVEARERAAAEAREKAAAEAREKAASEARIRAERAFVERVNAEARERAAERAAADARERAERAAAERAAAEKEKQRRSENDLEALFGSSSRPGSVPRQRSPAKGTSSDGRQPSKGFPAEGLQRNATSASAVRKVTPTSSADDWTSLFGPAVPASGEFQEIEGESAERRRARWDRHQRTAERAAKALDAKNQRDLQSQREQAERHRAGDMLDAEIKRWAAGKEGNLRALLSTLQYVLWPECGWQAVSLTDLITAAAVKKVYRKATLCVHPDKVQQKGATIQQKYIAEKVFDLLKEAWNKFNAEELF